MRYQKIHSQIWHDEKFMQFSPEAQRLFLYLMSSPHSNSIGLYVIPKMYICADLQMTIQQLKKPFNELVNNGLIMFDEAVNLLLIVNHLKHNKIENELQAKGAKKIVQILPKSKLYQEVIILLPKHYHKPLVEALRELYAIPEEKEKEETEEETETKEKWTLPENINPEVWALFEKHRKSSKTRFTDDARILNANILLENLDDQKEIVETTVRNGWAGLFPLKNKGGKKESKFTNLNEKDYHKGVDKDGSF